MARERKRTTQRPSTEIPELPEARPMPDQASPGGTEGVEPDWAGGASNVGEVINAGFASPAPYSTKDLPEDAPRVEAIREFHCDTCGQAFQTQALLNVHRRTAHRTHR
jgi:hypothetical protein